MPGDIPDERYVIDIIINARDQVAGAVAGAIAELTGLDIAADKSKAKMKQFGDETERVADKIRTRMRPALQETDTLLGASATKAEEHAAAMRKTREETDKATKSYKEANEALTYTERQLRAAETRLHNLTNAADQNEQKIEKAWKSVQKWSRELEQVEGNVENLNHELVKLNEAQEKHNKMLDDNSRAMERQKGAYDRAIQQVIKSRRELDRVSKTPDADPLGVKEMEKDVVRAKRLMKEHHDEIHRLARDRAIMTMDLDAGAFDLQAAKVEAMKVVLGSDVHINVDTDMAAALAKLGVLEAAKKVAGRDVTIDIKARDRVSEVLRGIHDNVENNRASIAAFDNQIRGLLAFGMVALFQPLLTMVVALSAELVALASSAVMAGGALGGALVAGASAALPAIGLLVGALFRVGQVMEAVQQQTLMRKQQFADAAKGDSAAADNLNAVANAADAVKDATVNLIRARVEARRQLQDLILSEKEAALAAEGASISQEAAQRRLQSTILSGDIGGLASANLDVAGASLDRQRAEMEARRAETDLRRQKAGSVLAPDQSVAQAEDALEQARRSLESARRTAAEAESGLVAAESNLKFFLSQLSGAERELYRAIMNIRRVWNTTMRPITDNIIGSFTFAVKRVTKILQDPDFLKSANGLSEAMSDQMDRITKVFTSPKWMEFWEQMMGTMEKAIKPLTGTFLQIANIFRRIALAARPVFRELIDLVDGTIDKFDDFVGRGKGLDDFFEDSIKHLRAWWKFAESIFGLFAALVGSSAETGRTEIQKLTKSIQEWTDWINTHGEEMQKFWEDSAEIVGELAHIVGMLAVEVAKAFDPESAKALASIMERIVIPAIAGVIEAFGQVVIIIDKISKNESAETLLKLAIAGTIAGRVFRTFVGMLAGVFMGITRLAGAFIRVGESLSKFMGWLTKVNPSIAGAVRMFGALALRVTGVVGVIVTLLAYAGRLGDVWDAVKDAARTFFGYIKPAFEDLRDAVDDAIGDLTGGGSLSDVLKFLGNLLADVLIPALKILGHILGVTVARAIDTLTAGIRIFVGLVKSVIAIVRTVGEVIGDVFSGIADYFEGWVKIIRGIIHGDFGEIWDGVKQVITAPFRAAWEIIKDIWNGVGDFFGGIGDAIAGAFEGVTDWISAPFNAAWELIKDGVNWLIENVINRIPGVEIPLIQATSPAEGGKAKTKKQLQRRQRRGPLMGGGYAAGGRVTPQATDAGGKIFDVAGGLIDKVTGFDFGLPDWLTGTAKWIKDRVIDLIEEGGKGALNTAKDIALGPLGLVLAGGGRVSGPDGLDILPAFLTNKEFVVTPHGESLLERVTGVPGILNWLAKAQRPATGYADGGRVGGGTSSRATGSAEMPAVGGDVFSQVMALLEVFGDEAIAKWTSVWNEMEKIMSKSIKDMVQVSDKGFDKMLKSALQAMRKMSKGIDQQMKEAVKTINAGMRMILDQTNKALKAFGVDEISLSATPVKKSGKAGGGFIGAQGERGADAIPAWIGRGEAVLNWAHQKIVDPAMHKMYGFGLGEMFNRTKGKHGQEAIGGFAGGFAGETPSGNTAVAIPGFPGEFIAKQVLDEALYFIQKYNLFVTDAFATSGHSGSGHLQFGTAMDVVPADGNWDTLEQAIADAVSRGLTVLYDGAAGSTPYPAHGRGHHAHFELAENIGSLRGAGMVAAEIKRIMVDGDDGVIKQTVQGSLDAIRDAAQKFIDAQMPGYGPHADITDLPASLDALNKSYPEGVTLAHNIVAAIAEWAGLPGETFADIAKGESSYQPGIRGEDPGGTFGYGLWQITSGYNDELIAKYGGEQGMYNPIKNALAAKELYDADRAAGGSGIGPWYGTRYVEGSNEHYTGPMPKGPNGSAAGGPANLAKGGFVHPDDAGQEFADGGIVGRRSGQGVAVPIIAHAGEWVVNEGQQTKLAALLGSTAGRIRDFLGFSGGPSEFQGGGEVGGRGNQWMPHFFEVMAEHFGRAIRKLIGGDPTFANQYGQFAGILGDLHLGIQQWIADLAELGKTSKDFTQDIARLRPEGNRKGGPNAERSFTQRADSLMDAIGNVISHGMGLFRSSKDDLAATIQKFFTGIVGEGGLLDQLSEGFDNLTTIMSTRLNKAIVAVDKHGKVIGRDLQPMQIIEHELLDLKRQLKYLLDEKGVIGKALREAKLALKRAQHMTDSEAVDAAAKALEKAKKDGDEDAIKEAKKALQQAKQQGNQAAIDSANTVLQNILDRQRDINATIADTQLSILGKMEERQQALVDRINDQADRAMSGFSRKTGSFGIGIRQRIAEAMGFIGKLPSLADKELEVMKDQQKELMRVLRIAERTGNRDLQRDIESQIADLEASIAEAVASKISAAAEEIDRQASRRQVGIDFINTIADVQAGFGQVEQGEQFRRAALVQQRSSLEQQVGALRKLLADAVAQGFGEGVTGPLEDQITGLMGELEQNTLAQYENTIAIRQASIDAITERQGFLGGVGDSLKGILETVGKVTGNVNLPKIIALVQNAIEQLTVTGTNLRAQMERFVGENMGAMPSAAMSVLNNLQGLHGEAFVSAVTGLNLNEIIDSLGGPQSPLAQQFEALLQAIIDNESALWSNTEELQNLQQQNKIQQFTSSAWQWFRQAIFTGMGGLLPQYQAGTPYYQAASGGEMTSDGLVGAHAGEMIIPARFSTMLRRLGTMGMAADMQGSGMMMAGPQYLDFATRRAATMQSEVAAMHRGASNDEMYQKMLDALAKDRSINIYDTDPKDAVATASRIAFESKIPKS